MKERLRRLGRKLDEARARDDDTEGAAARRDRSALSLGLRMASEFVAAILVGGVIGWQLDKWLGTSPFLLIPFFLLGTAAGVMGVMRSANRLNSRGSSPDDPSARA